MEKSLPREANKHSTSQRNPLPSTEYKSSLPCSQELAIGPYPEPDESSPYHRHTPLLKINFNIILQSTSRCSKWSLSMRFSDQVSNAYLIPNRATRPAHLILLDSTTLIVGKDCQRFVSSSCNFLHPPVPVCWQCAVQTFSSAPRVGAFPLRIIIHN
jgi:hypothetical protein